MFILKLATRCVCCVQSTQLACTVMSALVAYLFGVASMWLWLEVLSMHYVVTAGVLSGRLAKCYLPLAWGLPLLFAGVTAGVGHASYGAPPRCWTAFTGPWPFIFAGGILLPLLVRSAHAHHLPTTDSIRPYYSNFLFSLAAALSLLRLDGALRSKWCST